MFSIQPTAQLGYCATLQVENVTICKGARVDIM